MKPTLPNAGHWFLKGSAFLAFTISSQALTKLNNTSNLNATGSWLEGTAPVSTDVLVFDSAITGPLSVAVGASSTVGGSLQFTGIGGNVAITQSSGQTWTLGNGGIDMSAATADVTLGTTGAFIRWASANYGNLTVASGRTLTFNSTFSNQGNTKTIVMGGGGNITFNAGAGGGGAMGFSVQGGTTVTMNGSGGWSGASSKEVINGTLNLGHDSALGSATLNLGGTNASTPTLAATGGARTIANNVTLLATSLGGNPTIAGTNALTINGVLTNSGANRTLTVNNSALTTFGTGGIALSNDASNRTLTINGSGNVAVSGVVANGGTATASNLTYSGSGTLALSNANTFGGTLTATSGTTRIDHANAAQNATVSIGASNALTFGTGITTATFSGLSGSGDLALTNIDSTGVTLSVGNNNASSSYSGVLGGLGSLTKIGTGTLTLSGNNSSYAGGITLTGGTLSIGHSSGAGSSSGLITAATGTSIASNSGVGSGNVAAGITLSGTNASVTLTNANASGGFGGALSGTADQTVNISNAGGQNVNLNASNKQLQAFYGTVSIPVGNNLAFRSTSLNNGGDNALFEVNGTISTRNQGNVALGALSGSGTLAMGTAGLSGQDLTYTIGARNTSTTFSGIIQDGDTANDKLVNVTKTGSGSLTLSGSNTYTGNTLVSAGTLLVTGALAATDVTVGASGTIGGTGSLGGNLVFNAGGNLDLTGATLGLSSSNILTVDSGKTITLNGFSFSDIIGWDASSAADGTYTLVNGGLMAILSGSTPTISSPFAFSPTKYGYFQSGSLQAVIYTAVPEPRAALLGGLGMLALLRRRRK